MLTHAVCDALSPGTRSMMIKHIFCFQALATPCVVLCCDDHHIPNLYLENSERGTAAAAAAFVRALANVYPVLFRTILFFADRVKYLAC